MSKRPDNQDLVTLINVAGRASPVGLLRRTRNALRRADAPRGTVYLLLDQSTSMAYGGKLEQVKRGALRFFYEAYTRGYAVGIIGFGSGASCLLEAGRDVYRFEQCLAGLRPDGRTAMASALYLSLRRQRFRAGARAVILITDGQPNDKAATLRAARLVRAAGIELVAVGTSGADHAFLTSLTPRPELARWAESQDLSAEVAAAATALSDTGSNTASPNNASPNNASPNNTGPADAESAGAEPS